MAARTKYKYGTGECAVCCKLIAKTKHGLASRHKDDFGNWCKGFGQPALELMEEAPSSGEDVSVFGPTLQLIQYLEEILPFVSLFNATLNQLSKEHRAELLVVLGQAILDFKPKGIFEQWPSILSDDAERR